MQETQREMSTQIDCTRNQHKSLASWSHPQACVDRTWVMWGQWGKGWGWGSLSHCYSVNSFTVSDILSRPLLCLRRKVITSSNIRLPSVLPVPDTVEAACFLCLFLSLCVCVRGVGVGVGEWGAKRWGGCGGACVRACVVVVGVCVRGAQSSAWYFNNNYVIIYF